MGTLSSIAKMSLFGKIFSALRKKQGGEPKTGLFEAAANAVENKKKGVPTMPGGSPLGISQSGNVAGGMQASGGSPLGRMIR